MHIVYQQTLPGTGSEYEDDGLGLPHPPVSYYLLENSPLGPGSWGATQNLLLRTLQEWDSQGRLGGP